MKEGLLGGTALIGATAFFAGVAGAAEAPTWKLTGNANFQFYWVDQDHLAAQSTPLGLRRPAGVPTFSNLTLGNPEIFEISATGIQDHGWYFGVDEAELQLNASGTADNGLNYGFKIEINANTTDDTVADEARLQFSGGWGTLQMGDEDGAEDIMNYGGENLMGGTGGFDGDQDDYLVRGGEFYNFFHVLVSPTLPPKVVQDWDNLGPTFDIAGMNGAAPSYPTIAGDTSDRTKISFFSPRFAGFQVGASLTPTPNNGDNFKADGSWENHIGLGANYDNSFGDLRIRASAVYSTATNAARAFSANLGTDVDANEDVSAFSVGGIVGWGPFSLGANYTDNGDSGQPRVWDDVNNATITADIETSYWNVAGAFETGPMYFSVGYFSSLVEIGGLTESTYEHIALTADYTVAPGLGVYAEINMISDELFGEMAPTLSAGTSLTNDTTSLVVGANIGF